MDIHSSNVHPIQLLYMYTKWANVFQEIQVNPFRVTHGYKCLKMRDRFFQNGYLQFTPLKNCMTTKCLNDFKLSKGYKWTPMKLQMP